MPGGRSPSVVEDFVEPARASLMAQPDVRSGQRVRTFIALLTRTWPEPPPPFSSRQDRQDGRQGRQDLQDQVLPVPHRRGRRGAQAGPQPVRSRRVRPLERGSASDRDPARAGTASSAASPARPKATRTPRRVSAPPTYLWARAASAASNGRAARRAPGIATRRPPLGQQGVRRRLDGRDPLRLPPRAEEAPLPRRAARRGPPAASIVARVLGTSRAPRWSSPASRSPRSATTSSRTSRTRPHRRSHLDSPGPRRALLASSRFYPLSLKSET